MKRVYIIITFFCLFAFLTHGQSTSERSQPVKENADKKEIKNVPSADVKSKPARISSAARPSGIRPNQSGKIGKPEGTGKPEGVGKPEGTVKPPNAGKPAGTGKPPGI
jgi:hypothetical protein